MSDACATCPFKTRTRVGFDGPIDAKLAIIGEAPAMTEVRQGKPFVGQAGQLLDQFLGFYNIPRESIRIGNVLLCGPIDSDKEKLMHDPGPHGVGTMFEHALACCAERREAEGDLQSKVVLALGVSATWGLMGHRIPLGGKRPQRGALFRDWKGHAIFPTWHPAMLLRAGGQGGDARPGKTSDAEAQAVANDLAKAWRFANGEQEEFKFYRCDPADTVEFCTNARKAKKLIAVDIESDSLDALTTNLTIIGIAIKDADGVLVLSLWWPTATLAQREAIRALLADEAVPKVLHNFTFDQTVLERHDLPIRGPIRDTLLEHHVIAPECDHDLSSVVCNFLITNPWKAEYYAREAVRKRRGIKDIEDELQYNAGDAATTLGVAPYLDEECREMDVRHVADFDVRLSEVARHMRIRGVPLDAEVRDEIGQALKQRAKEAVDKIHSMAIEAINDETHPVYIERFLKSVQKTKRLSLASPYQMTALMDLLEVPAPPGSITPKTKLRSTKNEIIATIGHPLTRALIDYRASEKLVSTFVEGIGLRLGEDGRIHPDWKIWGAVTGRWTCAPNMMNWKKDYKDTVRNLRRMIVAPPGRIFVGADFAQVEFRIIALLAGQEDLLEALCDSTRDIHSENAARLYSDVWPILTRNMAQAKQNMEELERLMASATSPLQRRQFETRFAEEQKQYKESGTAMKRLRELTKRATYASLYGSTAENLFIKLRSDEKLRDMGMEIEPEQCVRFVQMFPQMWPQIEAWRKKAAIDAVTSQEIVSPLLGRKRPFPLGRLDPTQAVNHPVQGCLPVHTRVLVQRGGYRTLKSLLQDKKPTDEVWTGTQWAPFDILDRGKWQRAELELQGGTILPCDTRHEVLCIEDTGYVWKTFKDLKEGDRVAVPMVFPIEFSPPAPLPPLRRSAKATIQLHPQQIDADFWYWIGYYYGDGYLSLHHNSHGKPKCETYGNLFYVFGRHEIDKLEQCCNYWEKWGLHANVDLRCRRLPSGTHYVYTVNFYSVDLVRWLRDLSVPPALAQTKRVPERVFGESLANRKAFVKGLFDSDGYASRPEWGGPNLHLCQRPLLEDVRLLLRTLGVESSVRGPYKYGEYISYRLDTIGNMFMSRVDDKTARCKPRIHMAVPVFICEWIRNHFRHLPITRHTCGESGYVLWLRLLNGGTISVYTLKWLLDKTGVELPMPLYGYRKLKHKRELNKHEPTYTLAVHNSLHRFDSEGVVSKNTAADLMDMCVLDLWEKLDRKRDWIIMQIHDALVIETDEDRGEEVAALVTQTMTSEIELDGHKCLFPADAQIGRSWDQV